MKVALAIAVLSSLIYPFARAADEGKPRPGRARLWCKTGPEKRAPGQPLKLFFQYNLPFEFEPEDPTVPYGRQTFVLAGRPVVQLFFEKSPVAAGERGEDLAPMTCAFAKRPLSREEPNQAQILVPAGERAWMSQSLGQKPGFGQERVALAPTADWAFAYKYEKVFSLDIDDTKDFITAQQPRP